MIGIWALVAFSSMANKINALGASGSDYYVGKVVVSDGSSSGLGIGLVPIDVGLADQIRTLDGVGAVDPQVQMPFEDVKPAGFGIPKLRCAGRAASRSAPHRPALAVLSARVERATPHLPM